MRIKLYFILVILLISNISIFAQTVSSISNFQEMEYEGTYFQIRRIRQIDSKSKIINPTVGGVIITTYNRYIETTINYPFDFTDAISAGMMTKRMISSVIKKTTEIVNYSASDNSEVSRQTISVERTTYGLFDSNYLPQKVEMQHGSGTMQTAIIFNSYDSAGNLLGYTQKNGLQNTFTYYGVGDMGKANLVKTQANNLGQTTTYDYLPIIGVKDISDPNNRKTTFNYDKFNRLSNIKDQNNDIVKSFSYNFCLSTSVGLGSTIVGGGLVKEQNDCILGSQKIERSDKTSVSRKYLDNPCLEVILKPGFDTERKPYEAKIGIR